MKRKLIKQGVNALTVTLPAKWLDTFGLKAGDELDIEPEGPLLILRSSGKFKSEKAFVTLKPGSTHYYRQLLGNAYRKGFDEIIVSYERQDQIAAIQQFVEELMGFEIIDIEKNKIRIKSVAIPDIKEFEDIYKRTFFIIKTAFTFLQEDIANKTFDSQKMLHLQKNILKLCNFGRRILQKQGYPNLNEMYAKYVLFVINDTIMSQIKNVYLEAEKVKNVSERSKNEMKELFSYLSTFVDALLNKDNLKTQSLTDKKYSLLEQKKEWIRSCSSKEKVLVQEISILVRVISEYLSPLCLLSLKEEK